MDKKFLFLVPSYDEDKITKEYLSYLNKDDCLFAVIDYEPNKKKSSASYIRDFYESEVLPLIKSYKCKYLLICDADFFKIIAKVQKTDVWLGYILSDYLHCIQTVYVPSFKQVFFDPERTRKKIKIALQSVLDCELGRYQEPGKEVIQRAFYPRSESEIEAWLKKLVEQNQPLTCDIEAFSLKHPDAGIGTITFCWNKHEGISFPVDYIQTGVRWKNEPVRKLLRWFFENFNNKLIFHNIAYDAYILIYQLYMKNLLDTEDLLKGLSILLKNFEDTKLIAYLATNSCAGNTLGLKALAQEYCGNYAQDEIGDITKIDLQTLLEYNLVDGLATWYVYEKYYSKMINDNQLDIYEKIFKPSTKDIIQMQLTGLPLNMERVEEVKQLLLKDQEEALKKITGSEIGKNFEAVLKEQWVQKKNSQLKTKKVTIKDCKETFNPNSNIQLRQLLYSELSLPVIEKTNTNLPATDADTFEKLKNHTKNQEILDLLQGLIDYKAVSKILTAFIPAFEKSYLAEDGCNYLFGNFNLGGTVSGRLSSSGPNLQQIPATGSKYAKLIKSCFQAPEGWIFCGLDFNALEDHISALTTRDHNKLKVYIDNFDGHSLRAFTYWKEKMPDIELAKDNEICYKAKVGSTYVWFHENEIINYLGKQYTGKELYEFLTSKRI